MTTRIVFVIPLLALSACGAATDPTSPSPGTTGTALPGQVSYTAVGASDAVGYGSSVPCLPYTACPDGMGYVPDIDRRLRAEGRAVTLLNLGVPGAVLSQEIQDIGNSLGRGIPGNFLVAEMPFIGKDATLVTVFAGGNDANTIGAALDAGLGGSDPTGYMTTEVQNFGRDMKTLVAGIRSRAPSARIVVLNLPNLAALPYASGYSADRRQWLQQIAVGLSAQIDALTSEGVAVVDLMCDGSFYNPAFFSSDGFHPNDAGYAHLTDVMYPAVSTGTTAAPQASCSLMIAR
jgi:acyl-CoA thioesterase I